MSLNSTTLKAKLAEVIDSHLESTKVTVDVTALKTEYNALSAGVGASVSRLVALRNEIANATGKKSIGNGPSSNALSSASLNLGEAKTFAGVPFEANPGQ